MMEITANQIKTKGISALDILCERGDDAIITVNGKSKFVVMSMDKYNNLRELELQLALQESLKDIEAGKSYKGIDEHLKRISGV